MSQSIKAESSTIYTPPNWVDPLDWRQVFARTQPVEVDVGCGKGAFLLWAAQARPGANFLGIERLLVRLRKVDNKLRRLGLANVRLVRLEASYLVSRLVPPSSVAVYHVYFPDPWPKRRHHRRRLFTPEFIAALHQTLQRGGVVNIATDHAAYFTWIQERMTAANLFQELPPEPLPPAAATDFERIFVADGKSIYRSRYVRQEAP